MASPLRYLPYLGFVSAAVGSGYLVSSRTVLARDDGDGPNGQLVEPLPSRAQQLSKLRGSAPHRPFDLLIIGGGATGAGCAVDAATRCACRTC